MALSEEIKGISVKIGADTTELNGALKNIQTQTKGMGSSLQEINRLLKFDPSNTELLAQKHKTLKEAIEQSKQKVNALKQAQAEAKKQLADGKIDQGAYDQLTREIIKAEQQTKKYSEQLKDNKKNIKEHGEASEKSKEKTHAFADALKTASIAAAAATAAVAAAAVSLGKQVVSAYADYEQLIGGVETLFGNSADKVSQYANEAFKTTGLSANEYMETVTSFSASLLQSMGGDTDAAAEKADRALRDMSDNANKMGTDMSMIQSAYQGFAKANYTMLDNLKLGYGGTKTEMERLLKDAEAISGVKYDINSYADIIDAIGIIQDKMGITGTTAKEAESTITGSLNMLKSSYQNLITGIGNPDADVKSLVNNVVQSLNTLLGNVQPIIENIISVLPTVFEALAGALITMLPTLLETITGMFESVLVTIVQALPQLTPVVLEALMLIGNTIIDNLPLIIDNGSTILMSLIDGIISALPELIAAIPSIIVTIIETIIKHLPEILLQGVQILGAIISGLIQAIPELVMAIPQIILAIVETFKNFDWGGIGANIMEGIKEGILNAWENVKEAVSNVANNIKNKFCDIFGIESPSKWMRDNIGKNLDAGLAEGIEKYKALAINSAQTVSGAVSGAFGSGIDYGSGRRGGSLSITTPVILDGKVIATVVNSQLGVML